MKKIIQLLLASAVVIFFSACSTTRFVKPLKKDQMAVSLDFGGPIINLFGTKIPVPFTSASFGYGVDSTLTAFGSLHTTALGFGTLQLDGGITKQILKQKKWRPAITVAPIANILVDFHEGNTRFYPELDVNFYWQHSVNKPHIVYASFASWFDLFSTGPNNQPVYQNYYPNFAVGHIFEFNKYSITTEVKLLAPFNDNTGTPLEYNGINNSGSFGAYIGLTRKF